MESKSGRRSIYKYPVPKYLHRERLSKVAIDKNKTTQLINDIDELFEVISKPLPKEARSFLKEKIMGEVFSEVRKLIEESRPPVLFLVGRSGHGKSSLLNALANKKVAEVGYIKFAGV